MSNLSKGILAGTNIAFAVITYIMVDAGFYGAAFIMGVCIFLLFMVMQVEDM